MGYMGFGMRKEVYKRKAKKPFKKLKKPITSVAEDGSQAGYNASKTYQKIRFKPAYKRAWFWVVAILITTAVTYNFLETRVFAKNRRLATIALFEESGIREYYESEKSTLDSIVQFAKTKEGKIGWIGRGTYSGKMIIEVRSEDYHKSIKGFPSGDQHRDQSSPNQHLESEVIDGKLRFNINERQVVYDHHWSYDIEVKHIRDVNATFIKHLGTNYDELDLIIRKLAIKDFNLSEFEYGVIVRFNKFKRRYLFVFTQTPDSLEKDKSLRLKPIAQDVYWARSSYWW